MSRATENLREQLEQFRREESGTPVIFREALYYVRVEDASGAEAGQQGVPRGGLNQFIADTDPREFIFSASGFAPFTSELPPEVGEFIGHAGWSYEITRTTPNSAGGNTDEEGNEVTDPGDFAEAGTVFGIRCFGMKKIYS